MRSALLVTAAILGGGLSTSLQAQNGAAGSTAVPTAKLLWEPMIGYITAVAEELPESKYSFKPTPEVRSFGEMFGHVAGAQYLFCAAALGEPSRQEDEIEKTKKSKADLV
ncbi:MAG TPA: DinB family protein, partial [Gemmatimonadales bacterium]|nr:DinB family protein [Gemmatimonadales bacterium]